MIFNSKKGYFGLTTTQISLIIIVITLLTVFVFYQKYKALLLG